MNEYSKRESKNLCNTRLSDIKIETQIVTKIIAKNFELLIHQKITEFFFNGINKIYYPSEMKT